MKKSFEIILLIFFLLFIGLKHTYAQQSGFINILNEDFQTQTIVELEKDGSGTIRVFLVAEDNPFFHGISLSLVEIKPDGTENIFDTTQVIDSGVATFFGVPPGDYKIRLGCEQIILDSVSITGEFIIDQFSQIEETHQELDNINIVDEDDQTRAFSQLPFGANANISVSITTTDDTPVENINLTLVELLDDTAVEEIAIATTNEEGSSAFEEIVGGTYLVRIECPVAEIAGYSSGGLGVANVYCPTVPGGIIPPQEVITATSNIVRDALTSTLSIGAPIAGIIIGDDDDEEEVSPPPPPPPPPAPPPPPPRPRPPTPISPS